MFLTQYTRYADGQRLNSENRIVNLFWCLEGEAKRFYSNMVKQSPGLDYFVMIDQMGTRFDHKLAQDKLEGACQHCDEELVEWADRVLSLAKRAYPKMADRLIQTEAIERFCVGGIDQHARHYVMSRCPSTIDEAVNLVRVWDCMREASQEAGPYKHNGERREASSGVGPERQYVDHGKIDDEIKMLRIQLIVCQSEERSQLNNMSLDNRDKDSNREASQEAGPEMHNRERREASRKAGSAERDRESSRKASQRAGPDIHGQQENSLMTE